ncbi:CHAT domain-containing protein [Pleurocapsa sp. PCC 7319]|uniref:CHAT domain-containing protein n=1 Tax=Pleurocapsa sp. PCC 7319 TaxID=118161 RepID=UPI000346EBC4|nr:CHAT domain-containing protein [Pleurocapsa sp. PCC 7319]
MLRRIGSIWNHLVTRYLIVWFYIGLILAIVQFPVASQISSVQISNLEQLIQQGRDDYARSQFATAAAKWQKALAISTARGNKLQQAQALTYLSLVEQKSEKWLVANIKINHSLQLLKDIELKTVDFQLILAQTLNAQGAIALALGKFESALLAWQKASKIYEQLGDSTGITGSLINQAQALEKLGFYRRTCKTLLKAATNDYSCDFSNMNDWKMVLKSFEQLKEHKLKILGLQSLGNILRQLGDWKHSEQVLKQSLQLEQSSQEKSITLLSLAQLNKAKYKQARSLHNKTYLPKIKQEAKQKAISSASEALRYYRKAKKTVTKSGVKDIMTQVQLNELSLLLSLRQWFISQSLNLHDIDSRINSLVETLINSPVFTRSSSHFAIQAQLNFAQSLMEIEPKQQLAIPYINQAQTQARQLSDSRSESLALGIRGHFYEKQANWSQAEKFSRSALNISQTINATDLNAQWRSQLGRIYQAQGRINRAIIAFQGSVADLNILRQDLVSISSEIQFSWQQDIETSYRNLVELMITQAPDRKLTQANLQQTIEILDDLRIAEVEDFLNCNLPSNTNFNQQEIEPTAALIYPIILENQLEIVVRLPKSSKLQSYSIPISRYELEQTLIQWRTELERRFISPKSLLLSQKVYSWLVKPIEETLVQAKIKTLVFLLDGGFRNLPLAALYDGQQYLIEKQYAVATIPSLKLLSSQSSTKNNLNVLAFGLSEIRPDFIAHQGFSTLDNVKTELTEISSQVTSKKYLDREFTSNNLQQQINALNFPILHLATHGQFSSELAQTFLLAWDKRIDVSNLSNILQLRKQSDLQPIELLVLSACQTAAGDNQATIGLAGIAIESGAKSTLASLWNVQDSSIAKLMSQFYQELAKNTTKAEALRRSQVKLLHTPGYQAPFYWSPYILLGNWL